LRRDLAVLQAQHSVDVSEIRSLRERYNDTLRNGAENGKALCVMRTKQEEARAALVRVREMLGRVCTFAERLPADLLAEAKAEAGRC
jgi:hypothetical protein